MALIQLPVKVLDEKCISCQAMDLDKLELYADPDTVITEYQCRNIHLCQYIKNRIIRNEKDKGVQENGE